MASIDEARIRAIIVDAIGPHSCLREARESGLYVVRQRDEAIELAQPLAPRLARTLVKVPWTSRIQYEDLEQSALEGIVEGIDSFDPTKTYKPKKGPERLVAVTTHLFWRIRKRVFMEVQDTHWLLAKPSREDIEAYMKGTMDEGARRAYVNAVLNPVADADLTLAANGGTLTSFADGMSAAAYAHREQMHQ